METHFKRSYDPEIEELLDALRQTLERVPYNPEPESVIENNSTEEILNEGNE